MMPNTNTSGPVKVLSLDGGGIRGLSSLLILEKIMENIRTVEGLSEVPKPCERFDLIGGTSTGGIIAIMLGRLGMTVNQCIRTYRELAETAFTPKRRRFLPVSPSGAFSAKKLEAAIKQAIRENCTMESCVQHRLAGNPTTNFCKHEDQELHDESCTKTVVLAITKANVETLPTLFKTYDDSTTFSDTKIWEVARATSAATTFFKSIKVGRDEVEFIDAGFGHNNPCEALIEETKRVYPGREMTILSIGTGLGDVIEIKDKRISIIKALASMATTSKAAALRLHNKYSGIGGYYRFNVENGLKDITLSDWKQASKISSHTGNYLTEKREDVEKFIKVMANANASNQLSRREELAGNGTVQELSQGYALELPARTNYLVHSKD
ncbi:FabD/lysophospholipase-like protein [Ceratocystis lukuohia]|uniref:FabD/lysophospholipase-like protein n=1 Tax=Ceratocystis lukuohia TaxID=2019550 RepID=A0ABR4M9W6_9PEZI